MIAAALAYDPTGRAGWHVAVSDRVALAPPRPGLEVSLLDPDGHTVRLWLDPDAFDNLRSGLDLVAILHPRSLLRTNGDRSQSGDYTLTVEDADRIAVSFTQDGLRLALPFTRSEIQALSAAISTVEATAMSDSATQVDP